VVIIDSKTPSHSQAEELKADPFVVRVDQNNNSFVVRVLVDHSNNSYCIGVATTVAQYMHVESMHGTEVCLPTLYGMMLRVGEYDFSRE